MLCSWQQRDIGSSSVSADDSFANVCQLHVKGLLLPAPSLHGVILSVYLVSWHRCFSGHAPVLDWNSRMKIALGAARGLAYLHEEAERQVIYRDFKASNILLDKVGA